MEARMFDAHAARALFPALHRTVEGRMPVFLDGPGGTQVPQPVIDAMVDYLTRHNANCGGPFRTSRESDAVLAEAHTAAADLLNAPSPDEIVFGQNMTSLTFQISRSLGRTWKPGDAVLLTRLDHDANVRPWALAAQDAGAEVRYVAVRPDGTLDEDDFRRKLDGRVKLFALTCASNAIGTMPDVARLVREAKSAGALVYLDAVHFAPHAVIDVKGWGCDFLACSAYKFFGPHVGILWGRRALLEALPAYKVRPAPDSPPGRWMTGTQNHEGIAGTLAAIDYLASFGEGATRRERLVKAMSRIQAHEARLTEQLLSGLPQIRRLKVWGLPAGERRAPTVGITVAGVSATEVASRLAAEEVYAWSGHFYALELAEQMGVLDQGGFVRLGLVHYNTHEEVERALKVVAGVAS
jgi:cysteine desulfurase family protein (TIGR01976 family)